MKKTSLLFIIFIFLPLLLFSQNSGINENIKIFSSKAGGALLENKSTVTDQKRIIEGNFLNNPEAKRSYSIINKANNSAADINLTLYTGTGYVLSFDPKTLKKGETFTVNFSIVNWGTVTSGIFKSYVAISSDTIYNSLIDTKVGEATVQTIDGGFYRAVTVTCTVPSTAAAGTYYVYMIIDAASAIAETNENDNLWYFKSLLTVQSSTSDIDVAYYAGTGSVNSYDPHTLVPGGSFTANISVQNIGTDPSGEFKVSVGLSADQIYHFTDPECGNMMVSSINGGYYRNISITCNVPSSVTAGQYYVVIYLDDSYLILETDESNNSNYFSDLATVTTDFDPPTITHSRVLSATYNTPVTISATATDISGVKELRLYYRKSGEWTWDLNNSVLFQNGQATIPASFVTERGVDYRIYAEDKLGNSGPWENIPDGYMYYTSIAVTVPAANIASYMTKGGSDYTAYELFSTPYNFGAITASDLLKGFGTYKKNWRVMNYIGSNKFADGETSSLTSGSAYFLITDKGYQVKALTPGTTERISNYYGNGVAVPLGWSLIGNPFPFQVPVTYMYLITDPANYVYKAAELWTFKGSSGWSKPDYLYPWQGLAVYSATATRLCYCLGWVPSLAKIGTDKYSERAGKAFIDNSEAKMKSDGKNWFAQIIVKGETIMDQENYFGMQESASIGKDDFDKVEPPVFEEGVAAYFPHPEWTENSNNYYSDIQPINSNGAKWKMSVQSMPNEALTLEFKGLNNIPSYLNKFLFDLDKNTAYNLSNTNVIQLAGSAEKRNFEIVVGNDEYIKERSKNTKFPETFTLNQNFPNPFNPATVISFSLPSNARVSIDIFDINGKLIKSLMNEEKAQGFYEIPFDGSNLSSGIYYYRLRAIGEKSFTDTKKMILMK